MKKSKIFQIVPDTKIKAIFVLFVLLVLSGCQSKTTVRKLTNSKNINGEIVFEKPTNKKTETDSIKGAMYHLPLTVIKVSIPMKINIKTPGEFSDFAPCFFTPEEADSRIAIEKKEMSIEPPTFGSYGKADLSETYVIKTTGGYFESRTVSMTYKNGVLTDGSAESKDGALPFAIKTAEIIVGLGLKLGRLNDSVSVVPLAANQLFKGEKSGKKANRELPPAPPKQETPCYVRGFNYHLMKIKKKIEIPHADLKDARSENASEDKMKDISQKIIKLQEERDDWINRVKAAQKTWDRLQATPIDERQYLAFSIQYDKAEKASEELKNLKQEREKLLQANLGNVDPEIYKMRLKELDDKIKPLTESFFGKEKTFDWTGLFEAEPTKIAAVKQTNKTADPNTGNKDGFFKTLFIYAKDKGICYNDLFKDELRKDGILVPKEFQFDKCGKEDKDLMKVQIQADREPDDADFIAKVSAAKAQAPKNLTSGWYFRIPARAKAVLTECKSKESARCPDNTTEYGRQFPMIAQYGTVVSLPAKTAGRSSSTTIALDETTGALKNFKVSSSPMTDRATLEGAEKAAQNALDAADPLTKKKRELELIKTQNQINDEIKKASNSNNGNGSNSNSQP